MDVLVVEFDARFRRVLGRPRPGQDRFSALHSLPGKILLGTREADRTSSGILCRLRRVAEGLLLRLPSDHLGRGLAGEIGTFLAELRQGGGGLLRTASEDMDAVRERHQAGGGSLTSGSERVRSCTQIARGDSGVPQSAREDLYTLVQA